MSMQVAESSATDAEFGCLAQAMPDDYAARPAEQTRDVNRVEEIRAMAYAFYEARGCVEGYALDDWIKAEAAVMQASDDTRQASAGV